MAVGSLPTSFAPASLQEHPKLDWSISCSAGAASAHHPLVDEILTSVQSAASTQACPLSPPARRIHMPLTEAFH